MQIKLFLDILNKKEKRKNYKQLNKYKIMKTMKKEGKIVRIHDQEYKSYEKNDYYYIPKHIWKEQVRDVK